MSENLGLLRYFSGASTISDVSSSYMVGELDEAGKSSTYNLSGTPASDVSPAEEIRCVFDDI